MNAERRERCLSRRLRRRSKRDADIRRARVDAFVAGPTGGDERRELIGETARQGTVRCDEAPCGSGVRVRGLGIRVRVRIAAFRAVRRVRFVPPERDVRGGRRERR